MVALNAKLKRYGGSERQTKNMALKAKLKRDGGFECQTANMALKVKLRRYGAKLQREEDDGSKLQE